MLYRYAQLFSRLLTALPPAKTRLACRMYYFVHQYQNDKYLAHRPGASLVASPANWAALLTQLATGDTSSFIAYNHRVRSDFPRQELHYPRH